MSMLAEKFINRLEQQGLLEEEIVNKLRRKISKAKNQHRITAEHIAKLLVDAGHLTQFQATKLVAEFSMPKANAVTEVGVTQEVNPSDELGFKPNEGQKKAESEEKKAAPKSDSSGFRAPPPPPVAPPAPVSAADMLEEIVDTSILNDANTMIEGDQILDSVSSSPRTMTSPLIAAPTSVWDSRLLLIGGGALGTMVIIFVFLYFALTRGKADEIFELAQKSYKDGAYAQASKLYEGFLEDFPRHPQASLVRVRLVTSKLRQTYRSPAEGLRVAKEAIPTIEKEESFKVARPELAAMLPDIAGGFVDSAMAAIDAKKKEEFLKQGVEAMKLVNNSEYIPTSLRQSRQKKIDEVSENMKRVERDIFKERELKKAVELIETAATEGNSDEAYEIRHQLLSDYPGLADDALLIEAVKKVTEREQVLVKVVPQAVEGKTEDHKGTDAVRVILSGRRGQPVSGVAGHMLFVQAKGTVFALDAPQGEVLWSRFVGYDKPVQPTTVDANQPGSDPLIVDGRYNELLRLDAKTGKLKWRIEFSKSFAAPVSSEQQIYVTSDQGHIYQVDAESGHAAKHTKLPMSTRLPVAIDERRGKLYQVGHHDNLYVIDRETMNCQGVYYLGHKPGTIKIPPAVVLGHIFVAEEILADDPLKNVTIIHVLRTNEEGLELEQIQAPIRLSGRVRVPMFSSRRRILMVTDLGEINLFDVDLNSPERPVIEAASQPAHFLEPTLAFTLFDRGHLWVGEKKMTKYQVQTSTGKLPRVSVGLEDDQVIAPLIKLGEVLYVIRQREGMSGVTVAAVPMNDNVPRWEVELAGGASYVGTSKNNQLEILTPTGQLFQIDPKTAFAGSMVEPNASVPLQDAANIATTVGSVQVFSSGSGYREVAVLDSSAEPPLRRLELNVAPELATAPATGFQNGILVPLKTGEVGLLDLKAGLQIVDPFHPPRAAGAEVQWGKPAVFPDGKEFVIADNRRQIFKVGLRDRPRRNLAELASAEPQGNLEPTLATSVDRVFGILRTGASDTLMVFRRNDLGIAKEIAIDGHVVWGPQSIGDAVYLGTRDQLICVRGDAIAWAYDSQGGPVAGAPVLLGQELLAAFTSGKLAWLATDSGKPTKMAQSAEPLASSPVLVGGQVAVIGHGGNLLLIQVPTTAAKINSPKIQIASP